MEAEGRLERPWCLTIGSRLRKEGTYTNRVTNRVIPVLMFRMREQQEFDYILVHDFWAEGKMATRLALATMERCRPIRFA